MQSIKMGDSVVSFKVVLHEPQHEAEVRRFVIDRDVSTSVTYLIEKLVDLYPDLRRRDFRITWVDNEGDSVTIRTDEELVIALTEMNGPIYKLNVFSTVNSKGDEPHASGNVEGDIHPGVTCDACEGPVVGFRYKCVTCPDYDLCSQCEAKGIHPGHNMIRISKPQDVWPNHFYRRLNRMGRMQRRCCSGPRPEQERHSWDDLPRTGQVPPFRPLGSLGRGRARWLDSMLKGWTGADNAFEAGHNAATEAAQTAHDAAAHAAYSAHAAAIQAAHAAFSRTADASRDSQSGSSPEEERNEETRGSWESQSSQQASSPTDYLRNLGQVIASALDPFGVDVKIDIETPGGDLTNVAPSKKEKMRQEAAREEPKMPEAEVLSSEVKPEEPKKKAEEEKLQEQAALETEVTDIVKEETEETKIEDEVFFEDLPRAHEEYDELVDVICEDLRAASMNSKSSSVSGEERKDTELEGWTLLEGSLSMKKDEKDQKDSQTQEMASPPDVLYASINGTLYPELPEQEPTPLLSITQPEVESDEKLSEVEGSARPAERQIYPTRRLEKKAEKLEKKAEKIEKKIERARSEAEREKLDRKAEKIEKRIERIRSVGAEVDHQPKEEPAKPLDPKVKVALEAMLNMGFTNDGGWLTQLLEMKNGDIGKVLDVLQPVNPATRR